jgi:transcriptional regulator with XRE-family HTH domain
MGLSAELAGLLSDWLAAGRNRNLQSLATKSGVSYSTVRRIAQGEVEPGLSNTIAIASIVYPRIFMFRTLSLRFGPGTPR